MIPITENLVDKTWLDKPNRPDAALIPMNFTYTGVRIIKYEFPNFRKLEIY